MSYSRCQEVKACRVELNSGSDLCERVFGVHWNVGRDAFGFAVEENGNVTRRTVLSTICFLYDSLDFAPMIITANVFMHELCRRVAS